jgi:hypothetical protein
MNSQENFGCFSDCKKTSNNEEECESWCRTPLGSYQNYCWARTCDKTDLHAWCSNGMNKGIGIQKTCEGCCNTGLEYDYINTEIVPKHFE